MKKDLTISKVAAYLQDKTTNNYINSDNTVRSYRRILTDFVEFGNGDASDQVARSYRDHLTQVRDSDQVKSCLYVLSNFCQWLDIDDPFYDLARTYRKSKHETHIKRQVRDDRVLIKSDIDAMLTRAKIAQGGKVGIWYYVAWRNWFILKLLSEYGMRIDALVKVDIHHIDFSRRVMTIMASKNQVPYPVPVISTIRDIQAYLNVRRQYMPKLVDADALLLSKSGRRLSDTSARRSINAIAEQVGVYKSQRSTHQLRHYRATRYYKDGMTVDLISAVMGVSVNTLRSTYLHLTSQDTISEYEAWSKHQKDGFVCPRCGYDGADVEAEKLNNDHQVQNHLKLLR